MIIDVHNVMIIHIIVKVILAVIIIINLVYVKHKDEKWDINYLIVNVQVIQVMQYQEQQQNYLHLI